MRTAKSNPKPTKISNVHSSCTSAVPSYPEWTLLFFELIFPHSEPDKQRIVLSIVLQLPLAAETFTQLDSSRRPQAPVRGSASPSEALLLSGRSHLNCIQMPLTGSIMFACFSISLGGVKREEILESASTSLRVDCNLVWTIQERM